MDKKTFRLSYLQKDNALKIFGVGVFALTIVCAALATLSRTLFFDDIGYYRQDALIPKIFIAVCALAVLFVVVLCFVPSCKITPDEQSYPLPARIGAFVLSAGFLLLTLNSIRELVAIGSDFPITWDFSAFLTFVMPIVIQALAAVHFLRVGALRDSTGGFNLIGNVAFILYALSAIALTYFDVIIPMNSPSLILLHITLLSAMLLAVNEARVGLGSDRRAFHAFSAALCTIFSAAFSVSEAFAYAELLNDPTADQGILTVNSYLFIVSFIFVFSATRLACICFIKRDGATEPIESDATTDGGENTSDAADDQEQNDQEQNDQEQNDLRNKLQILFKGARMTANDRIQWFHRMVSDKCYPNSHDIAEKFNISIRQAQRDIEHIRTALAAPLVYSSAHKGYFYQSDFFLPSTISTESESDYGAIIAGIKDFTDAGSRASAVQMQLPYSAVLEITDKITVMNLRSFIVGEERRHRYRCEFPSIELFLGVIMSTGAEIRIISPDWLREKLIDFANRILICNRNEED